MQRRPLQETAQLLGNAILSKGLSVLYDGVTI